MITTFYSFKGGVGRSMAVANVAWLLYRAGLRVLVVDWDLEAPGISRYFADAISRRSTGLPTELAPDVLGAVPRLRRDFLRRYRSAPGLVDLIYGYRNRIDELLATEDPKEQRDLVTVEGVVDVRRLIESEVSPRLRAECLWPVAASPDGSSLTLLGPGRRPWDPDGTSQTKDDRIPTAVSYSEKLRSLDWDRFYSEYGGFFFFEALRSDLQEQADIVLIDSRTGFTEMGGTCVLQMADLSVLMAAPNYQNVDGILTLARTIEERYSPPAVPNSDLAPRHSLWMPVACRVDAPDRPSTAEVLRGLDRRVREILPAIDYEENERPTPWEQSLQGWRATVKSNRISIPYVADFSGGEELVVLYNKDDDTGKRYRPLIDAYADIATQMLSAEQTLTLSKNYKRNQSTTRVSWPEAASSDPPAQAAVWVQSASIDLEWGRMLASALATKGYRVFVGLTEVLDALPELWVDQEPDASRHLFEWIRSKDHVQHVVPLLSANYFREFSNWNPLEVAFNGQDVEILIGTEYDPHLRVTPVLLDPLGTGDWTGVPPAVTGPGATPRWTRIEDLTDERSGLLARIVDWMVDPKAANSRRSPLRPDTFTDTSSLPAGISPTRDWDDDRIRRRYDQVLKAIDWHNTTGSARRWWEAFEVENNNRKALVLRLAEELQIRKATITDFFLAYVYSNTDNIQANLHYLDYTRLKKQEEKRKRAKAAAAKAKRAAKAAETEAEHEADDETDDESAEAKDPAD